MCLAQGPQRSDAGEARTVYNNDQATACDFQQCDILTSEDSDEPVQPPLSLFSLTDIRSVV